jgi:hypothetical protein
MSPATASLLLNLGIPVVGWLLFKLLEGRQ